MSPRFTRVASLFTTKPELCKPMKAMKRPIPPPMAYRKLSGIAFTMASRTLVSVSKINMRPSISTAVSANCHVYPIIPQMVNTKKAFKPIPGARPYGSLAQNAITRQPTIAASAVAVKTAPSGMSPENMLGFTAKIYDMVRKVVIPAIISVRGVVSLGFRPNSFFNMIWTKFSFSSYFIGNDVFF